MMISMFLLREKLLQYNCDEELTIILINLSMKSKSIPKPEFFEGTQNIPISDNWEDDLWFFLL